MLRNKNQKTQGFPKAKLSTKENEAMHLRLLEEIIFNLEF